jgi:nucleoside-diphosphate-sugar epimerase
MRVCVTGATGFIGTALLSALLKENFDVCSVVRSSSGVHFQDIDCIKVDGINSNTNWGDALKNVDCVVHCAGRAHVTHPQEKNADEIYDEINLYGSVNLLKSAINSGVSSFIFLSSVKAVGECTLPGSNFNLATRCMPEDAYGRSKLKAENALLALAKSSNIKLTIVRLPLVYGPKVRANMKILVSLSSFPFPLIFPKVPNFRSFVGLGNLIDFILHCIRYSDNCSGVFFVSDNSDQSTEDLVKTIRNAKKVLNLSLKINNSSIEYIAKIFNAEDKYQKLFGSLQVDVSETLKLTGWTPPNSFETEVFKMLRNS